MPSDTKQSSRNLANVQVTVRVLPKGHGQVHTGKDIATRVEPDDAREQLTGDARLKADTDALVAASVACGQTYAKGERVALSANTARQLEDRGFVEIVEDA
jgi:hypothetical protein